MKLVNPNKSLLLGGDFNINLFDTQSEYASDFSK